MQIFNFKNVKYKNQVASLYVFKNGFRIVWYYFESEPPGKTLFWIHISISLIAK